MSARQSTVLALLTVLAMVSGYLGTLLTQTLTFAADEFDASDTAQGVTLAVVRVGVVLSLVLVALADRRGRRSMLLTSAFVGCVVAATGALAPGLVFLGTSQTVARGLSTALAVLIGIVAVEEMPAGSRAYAVSHLAMTGAQGAGLAVLSHPLADHGIAAWRILYVIPLLFLLAIRWVGRHLPETKRFLAHDEDAPDAVEPDRATAQTHRWRFLLLAMSGFLAAIFTAPAAQFLNEFLRSERDFSAFEITLFTIGTNTPGGIGIIVGGRLADTKGRRIVGAVSLIGGVGLTVLMYLAMGAPMWILSVFGALIGAAAVPALGVYGPELFPTNLRGRANAGITLLAVAGSSLGLLIAGVLIDRLDSFGATMAILAAGPAILAFLVLAFYPETAHLELEEINPEDARPDTRPDLA
jgi:MFS family permease